MGEAEVRAAFAQQAAWCPEQGSPLTGMLMHVCAERLTGETAPGRRILSWPGQPESRADALPLRLAGALHGLVLAGEVPGLARMYPPHPLPDEDALWREVDAALHSQPRAIDGWLDHAPQTNEVTRCAALMAGLRVLAARCGSEMDLFEVGASAGLNLLVDRYRVHTGTLASGPADSPVQVGPVWTGGDPPDVLPRIGTRRGVDIHPLRVVDPAQQIRLLSFVWPEHTERLARLRAAISVAAADPPELDEGDAAPWVEHHLRPAGRLRVLWNSIAFQYFPAATQARITRHMHGPGAGTAWLRFEMDPDVPLKLALRLRLPDGSEHLLGRGSGHGHDFEWLGGDAAG